MRNSKKFIVNWSKNPDPDSNMGLYYEARLVSEVIPTLEKIQKVVTSSGDNSVKYWVRLKDAKGTDYGVKAVTCLEHLPYYKLWGCGDALLTASEKSYHLAKLQEDSCFLETEVVYEEYSGFIHESNKHYLIWGNEIMGASATSLPKVNATQYIVRRNPTLSEDNKGAFIRTQLESYLSFWPGVTEPLFYSSLHCITKLFLDTLNVDSGHLTLLVGPPGHLKTTLAKRYCLWCEKPEKQQTTFQERKDNETLLNTILAYAGQNFLADDLHKIASDYGNKKQKNRLDEFARIVSSGVSCAGVIVTGESVMDLGIFSCLDRILQIKVPKLQSAQLTDKKLGLKNLDPLFMPEVARYYANQLVAHYNEVITDIDNFLALNKVSMFDDSDNTMRVGRHAMFICLTELLFRNYCCNGSEKMSKTQELHVALQAICRLQEDELRKFRADEEHDYVRDLLEIFNEANPYVAITTNPYALDPEDENTCLYTKHNIYISKLALMNAYTKLLKRNIDFKKILTQLKNSGILETETYSDKKRLNGKYYYVISNRALDIYEQNIQCD